MQILSYQNIKTNASSRVPSGYPKRYGECCKFRLPQVSSTYLLGNAHPSEHPCHCPHCDAIGVCVKVEQCFSILANFNMCARSPHPSCYSPELKPGEEMFHWHQSNLAFDRRILSLKAWLKSPYHILITSIVSSKLLPGFLLHALY